MGQVNGFLEIERQLPGYRPVGERLQHYSEFEKEFIEEGIRRQGARCMDCGVPFCHTGCPLGNVIPEWNDLVYKGRWKSAIQVLHSTNSFPEITGRVCPAPCEASCVLNLDTNPVTIKKIEKSIADRALQEDWVVPQPPSTRTGKKVAVVGSGPSGMAAAQQLNRAGHTVTLLEKADRAGGLLRYGIPDFKLEKRVVDFRVAQMAAEGVQIVTGVHVGRDYSAERLLESFDAILLCCGSEKPRDLSLPGRELRGIHFAMDYLTQQNRRIAGDSLPEDRAISAKGKRVVILGGGDTGSDCLGTAHRQGATIAYQFELLPKPPEARSPTTPWPYWPMMMRTSTSHEEGGLRSWSVLTKRFSGDEHGNVRRIHFVRVELGPPDATGRRPMVEVPGSEAGIDCDLVLLALGFLHPVREGLVTDLGLKINERGNVAIDKSFMTSRPGVFSAGDMSRGQSLVVWAIADGRKAAQAVDQYLMGSTALR